MVSFSSFSSMLDLKKLTFPDQFLSSPRRKVVSPFGLGILLSFIVLSVVLFNVSLRGNNGNGSFLSWPFSGGPKVSDRNETLKAYSGGSNKSVDLVYSDGTKSVFEKLHAGLGNGSEVVNNGSGIVGKEKGVKGCVEKNSTSCGLKVGFSEDGKSGNLSKKGDLSKNVTEGFGAGGSRSFMDCDIYNGRWVRDDLKPYYPAGSCPFIDRDFDCRANGRPDSEYLKWR